jgi:hypothetical protein
MVQSLPHYTAFGFCRCCSGNFILIKYLISGTTVVVERKPNFKIKDGVEKFILDNIFKSELWNLNACCYDVGSGNEIIFKGDIRWEVPPTF